MTRNSEIKKSKPPRVFAINYKVFLILLLCIPLYLFNNLALKLIGNLAIIALFIFLIHEIIFKFNTIRVNSTWGWFTIFVFYSLIMVLRTPSARGYYATLLQVLLMFAITLFSSLSLDETVMKTLFNAIKVLGVIIAIPALVIANQGGGMSLFMFNQYYNPVIYKFILPSTFFFLAGSKNKLIKVLFFSLLYLLMTERTSAFVLIIIYCTYLLLGVLRKSKFLYKTFFILTFFSVIGFTYFYVELQYMEIGYWLNDLFRQYTGGNFFSGRNGIWEVAFGFIKESPLWGYGMEHRVLSSAGISLSPHNTYIYLLLQGGLIGVFIFFMFLYSIWKTYFYKLDDDIVRTSTAYLVGIILFINFEVTMIANTIGIGIFFWWILGIGLMRKNSLDASEKVQRSL